MPLKLTLKPNEKVLIGTAVILNAGQKCEIIIQNTVPVLREKDIITEKNADTLGKKIYHSILNMYVEPENEKKFHDTYFKLIDRLLGAAPHPNFLAMVLKISKKILEGNHYQALKECRKLVNYEAEVLENVPR